MHWRFQRHFNLKDKPLYINWSDFSIHVERLLGEIDGECDRQQGTVQGFNIPQRVLITVDAQPGESHTIARLAANGPLAAPGGAVFVRYANLAFEWREDA